MERPSERLKDQTCIISGASSGIGKAVAKAMALEGARVVVNYHGEEKAAEALVHWIEKESPGDAMAYRCDVSREGEVEEMFRAAVSRFGTVDICVANAGIQMDHPLHQMPLESWQRVLDVNLTGQFLCARAAIRVFLDRGPRPKVSKSLGKIVHISSVHQKIPWAGHANYAASKGALPMLVESICQGYAHRKIRCNGIAPGAIKTAINKEERDSREEIREMLKLIPYGRIGDPEDIAKVACWLASDESEYINGSTIFVDGGMHCYPAFKGNG